MLKQPTPTLPATTVMSKRPAGVRGGGSSGGSVQGSPTPNSLAVPHAANSKSAQRRNSSHEYAPLPAVTRATPPPQTSGRVPTSSVSAAALRASLRRGGESQSSSGSRSPPSSSAGSAGSIYVSRPPLAPLSPPPDPSATVTDKATSASQTDRTVGSQDGVRLKPLSRNTSAGSNGASPPARRVDSQPVFRTPPRAIGNRKAAGSPGSVDSVASAPVLAAGAIQRVTPNLVRPTAPPSYATNGAPSSQPSRNRLVLGVGAPSTQTDAAALRTGPNTFSVAVSLSSDTDNSAGKQTNSEADSRSSSVKRLQSPGTIIIAKGSDPAVLSSTTMVAVTASSSTSTETVTVSPRPAWVRPLSSEEESSAVEGKKRRSSLQGSSKRKKSAEESEAGSTEMTGSRQGSASNMSEKKLRKVRKGSLKASGDRALLNGNGALMDESVNASAEALAPTFTLPSPSVSLQGRPITETEGEPQRPYSQSSGIVGGSLRRLVPSSRRSSSTQRPSTRDRRGGDVVLNSVNISEAALRDCSLSLDDINGVLSRPLSRQTSNLSQRQVAALQRTSSFLSRHHTPPPALLQEDVTRFRRRRRVATATAASSGNSDGEENTDECETSSGTVHVVPGAPTRASFRQQPSAKRRVGSGGSRDGSEPSEDTARLDSRGGQLWKVAQSSRYSTASPAPSTQSSQQNALSPASKSPSTGKRMNMPDVLTISTSFPSVSASEKTQDSSRQRQETAYIQAAKGAVGVNASSIGDGAEEPFSPVGLLSAPQGEDSSDVYPQGSAEILPGAAGASGRKSSLESKGPETLREKASVLPMPPLPSPQHPVEGKAETDTAQRDSNKGTTTPSVVPTAPKDRGALVNRSPRAVMESATLVKANTPSRAGEAATATGGNTSIMTTGSIDSSGNAGASQQGANTQGKVSPTLLISSGGGTFKPTAPARRVGSRNNLSGAKAPATATGVTPTQIPQGKSPAEGPHTPASSTPTQPPQGQSPSSDARGTGAASESQSFQSFGFTSYSASSSLSTAARTTFKIAAFPSTYSNSSGMGARSEREGRGGAVTPGSSGGASAMLVSTSTATSTSGSTVHLSSKANGAASEANKAHSALSPTNEASSTSSVNTQTTAPYLEYANRVIKDRMAKGESFSSLPSAGAATKPSSAVSSPLPSNFSTHGASETGITPALPNPGKQGSAKENSLHRVDSDASMASNLSSRRQRQRVMQAYYDDDDEYDVFSSTTNMGSFTSHGPGANLDATVAGGGSTPRPIKLDLVPPPSSVVVVGSAKAKRLTHGGTGDGLASPEDTESDASSEGDDPLHGFRPAAFDRPREMRRASHITLFLSSDNDSLHEDDNILESPELPDKVGLASGPTASSSSVSRPYPRLTFAPYTPPPRQTQPPLSIGPLGPIHARWSGSFHSGGARSAGTEEDRDLAVISPVDAPVVSGPSSTHNRGSRTTRKSEASDFGMGSSVLWPQSALGSTSGSSAGALPMPPLLPKPATSGVLLTKGNLAELVKSSGVALKPSTKYAPDPAKTYRPIPNTFGLRGERKAAAAAAASTSKTINYDDFDEDGYEDEEDLDYDMYDEMPNVEVGSDGVEYEWYWEEMEEEEEDYGDDEEEDIIVVDDAVEKEKEHAPHAASRGSRGQAASAVATPDGVPPRSQPPAALSAAGTPSPPLATPKAAAPSPNPPGKRPLSGKVASTVAAFNAAAAAAVASEIPTPLLSRSNSAKATAPNISQKPTANPQISSNAASQPTPGSATPWGRSNSGKLGSEHQSVESHGHSVLHDMPGSGEYGIW